MNSIKIITIEGKGYLYSIEKIENNNGIIINLFENKEPKIISFKYEALSNKLVQDIQPLFLYINNIDAMVNSLKDIFDKGKITVEKREEKYIMIINAFIMGNQSKYEIEIEKIELITNNNDNNLNLKIKDIDNKFKQIKDEINALKKLSQTTINKEDKKKIIKEIKDELNINECIKEALKDKEIKDILFKEFEERLSNKYIIEEKSKEKEEKNDEKVITKNLVISSIKYLMKNLILKLK